MRITTWLPLLLFATFTLGCGSGSGGLFSENSSSSGGPVGDPTGFKLTCEEARFVTLLNLYRQSKGLTPVKVSQNGVLSSRFHAQDMIDKSYFSHTEPSGRDFNSRAAAFNYGAWAENIAAGNSSASGTFCQWKNSPGHDSNMQGSHKTTGIGRAIGGGYGTYWSSNFGSMTSDTIAEPLTIEPNCAMPAAVPGC